MSQHDFNIANQTASNARADINNALAALASTSSGSSEPATKFANQLWYDTGNNLLKLRNEANSAWITLGTVDQSGGKFTPNRADITIANLAASAVVTSSESMTSNDNNTSVPTTASVIDYVATAKNSLGINQSWAAVSRTSGTSYQNTTGNPIQISAGLKADAVTDGEGTSYIDSTLEVSSNGSTWVVVGKSGSGSAGMKNDICVIIPPNHYYRFNGEYDTFAVLS